MRIIYLDVESSCPRGRMTMNIASGAKMNVVKVSGTKTNIACIAVMRIASEAKVTMTVATTTSP